MDDKAPTNATIDAIEWLRRFDAGEVSSTEIEGFTSWLAERAENPEEYVEVDVIWDDLSRVSETINVDEILKKGNQDGSNVVKYKPEIDLVEPLATTNSKQKGKGWFYSYMAVAATAAMLVVSIMLSDNWMAGVLGHVKYLETDVGEQRSVSLEDGSVIHLNTDSKVSVEFEKSKRYVKLIYGEVLFDIEKDRQRPFFVEVNDSLIRVVGTRFNVRVDDKATTVTVVEGQVAVVPDIEAVRDSLSLSEPLSAESFVDDKSDMLMLIPGQQVHLSESDSDLGAIDAVKENIVDSSSVLAWTERRLIFEGEELVNIVREFNRYNSRQFIVSDASIEGIRLTGVFDANDLSSFLAYLGQSGTVQVVAQSDGDLKLIPR